jgi:hypothetical protein
VSLIVVDAKVGHDFIQKKAHPLARDGHIKWDQTLDDDTDGMAGNTDT